MGKKLLGLIFLLCGVAVFAGTVAVEIAWLGFCFGTVIVGILLLIFAPTILLFPANLGFVTGMAIWAAGLALISSDDDERYHEINRKFHSREPGDVDPRVVKFIQPQVDKLSSLKVPMVIDDVVIAYISVVISAITRKDYSLRELKPMCHRLFSSYPGMVDSAFGLCIEKRTEFQANVKKLIPIVMDELKRGDGVFVAKYVVKANELQDDDIPFGDEKPNILEL